MAEQASERIQIDATPERCLEVALDVESYPRWVPDVKQVTVIDTDAEGHALHAEFRAAALGKSTRYVLAYDYSKLPGEFSWSLSEGDLVSQLDGTYRFEPDGDGTRVHYALAVSLKVPMPGLIKRRAAGRIVGAALKDLKAEVERSGR